MYGTILDWPRKKLVQVPFFRDLLNCAKCTGFWSGVSHVLALAVLFRVLGPTNLVIDNTEHAFRIALTTLVVLSFPLQSSAACYIADWLIEKLTQDVSNFFHANNQKSLKGVDDGMTLING